MLASCEGCAGLHDAAARYPLAGRSATVSAWLAAVNSEGGAGHGLIGDFHVDKPCSVRAVRTAVP